MEAMSYCNQFGRCRIRLLLKTNANGDTLWTRRYGGSDYDDVRRSDDRRELHNRWTTYSFGNGESDIYLIRTDTAVIPCGRRLCGGIGQSWTVQQTADGGFIVSATPTTSAEAYDALLIKTDADAMSPVDKTYGGAGTDYGFQVSRP